MNAINGDLQAPIGISDMISKEGEQYMVKIN